jgi:hypothetical protein
MINSEVGISPLDRKIYLLFMLKIWNNFENYTTLKVLQYSNSKIISN